MSDSELCLFTTNLCIFLTRDLADLQDFGITSQKIATLQALGDAFEVFPNDDYYLGAVMEATEIKQMKAEELKEAYRKMVLRVTMIWGEDQSMLRRVGASEYYAAPDDKLITLSNNAHLFLTEHLTQLAPVGLTQELLDAFQTLIQEFDVLISTQKKAVDLRDKKARERGNKGNELYQLVSMYCEIGKKIYARTDISRYNDYVIYGHAAGPLKPPVMIGYRPGDFVISWGAVENATSYELEYSPDGSTWTVAYTGGDNAVQYIPAVEGWAYFRCRARNANGYGEFSEVLKTGYYQILPPPSNIGAKIEANTDNGLMMVWDEVPSATNYLIYASIVSIGKPEENYELFDKTESTKYKRELERGVRYYFQLVAENSAQTSLHSKAVYVDVEAPLPS